MRNGFISFFHWIRTRLGRQPKVNNAPIDPSTVVIGPPASGKTALVSSLHLCMEKRAHSFQQYHIAITRRNADYGRYVDLFEHALKQNKLATPATDLTQFTEPQFTIELTPKHSNKKHNRKKRPLEAAFTTLDAAGGLLVSDTADSNKQGEDATKQARQTAKKKLECHLQKCNNIILCLPMFDKSYLDKQAYNMTQFIENFCESEHSVKKIIVCFSKYEQCGLRFGRSAYRTLAKREQAKIEMEAMFARHDLQRILGPLQRFDRHHDKSVWCTPVSTFGFVGENGGANVDVQEGNSVLRVPNPSYWSPFLTLDPFLFLMTGTTENSLIHPLGELDIPQI